MLVQEILTRTQDSTVKLSLLKTVIQIIIHEPQIIISLALDFLLFDLLITWHKAQRLVITEVFIDGRDVIISVRFIYKGIFFRSGLRKETKRELMLLLGKMSQLTGPCSILRVVLRW